MCNFRNKCTCNKLMMDCLIPVSYTHLKQGYLLEHYLSLIFEGLSECELTFETADEGFRTGGDLQGLLFHVLDGTESQPQSPHPLYPRMKEILLSMLIS